MMMLLMFCTLASMAQTDAELKLRAAQKVGQMNNYVIRMADKKIAYNNRVTFRKNALNLFIGRGGYYTAGGIRTYAKMQVSNINGIPTKTQSISNYFQRLIELRYTDVQITTTDIIDMAVSDLRQIDDNKFECSVYYVQTFCGYRDGVPVYCGDKTTKRVQVIIEIIATEMGGYEFVVLLGDTQVISTEIEN